MPINIRDIREISKFILNYPISNEVGLEHFVDILACRYIQYDLLEVEELLTDVSDKLNERLCHTLTNSKPGLNSANHNFGEIIITPSGESIMLSANDVNEFEADVIDLLSTRGVQEKGIAFEVLTKFLFEKLDFDLKSTPSTGDEGIDLYGTCPTSFSFGATETLFIQCKYYEGAADINVVKKVYADVLFNLMQYNSNIKHPVRPILVVKNNVTPSAFNFAEQFGVTIIILNELIKKAAEIEKLNIDEFKSYLESFK